jgi:hypothetical protein
VKTATGFPIKRIALAVVISLLGHGLLLWQWPKFEPFVSGDLPPLQAKIEALPGLAQRPVQRKPKAKPLTPPQTVTEPVAVATPEISDVAVSAVAAASAFTDTITPEVTVKNISHPLLPRKAQLTFAVQYGSGGFKVGEVRHVLENRNGRYTLRAETQTTGVASLFKNFYLKQISSGLVTQYGLRPESYVEDKADASGKQTSTARFDWAGNKIHFANGSAKPLLEQAQDILSLSYQLSQMPLGLDTFPIALSNGRSINQYFIAVGEETIISTTMGELRTIPLRKVQSANEDGLIIWLALEYRLLPVKILYLDKSGEVSANMLITDIRVSDE